MWAAWLHHTSSHVTAAAPVTVAVLQVVLGGGVEDGGQRHCGCCESGEAAAGSTIVVAILQVCVWCVNIPELV